MISTIPGMETGVRLLFLPLSANVGAAATVLTPFCTILVPHTSFLIGLSPLYVQKHTFHLSQPWNPAQSRHSMLFPILHYQDHPLYLLRIQLPESHNCHETQGDNCCHLQQPPVTRLPVHFRYSVNVIHLQTLRFFWIPRSGSFMTAYDVPH